MCCSTCEIVLLLGTQWNGGLTPTALKDIRTVEISIWLIRSDLIAWISKCGRNWNNSSVLFHAEMSDCVLWLSITLKLLPPSVLWLSVDTKIAQPYKNGAFKVNQSFWWQESELRQLRQVCFGEKTEEGWKRASFFTLFNTYLKLSTSFQTWASVFRVINLLVSAPFS